MPKIYAISEPSSRLHNQCTSASSSGSMNVPKSSWIDNFRRIYQNNKRCLSYWFWDNLNWQQQSLWIGKLKTSVDLPEQDDQISEYLVNILKDLNSHPHLESQVYAKFYFSRNIDTQKADINYLLICNQPRIPEEFTLTQAHKNFEKYQLTESIINLDKDFRSIINHYLNWSNVYKYFNLVDEISY